MDRKQVAQSTVDQFNDRSFRQKSNDEIDANVVIVDGQTKHELHGPAGFVQYAEGYVIAITDIKGTAHEHAVNGNKVTTRVNGESTFTGTLQTPESTVAGEWQEARHRVHAGAGDHDAGKIRRFAVTYDMQDFMRQLGR